MRVDVNPLLLDRARELGARESGLAVVATLRADGSAQASVVNAGVIEHPLTAEAVVAFVARAGTRKLANLRVRPRATVVFRSGWEWVAVEGDTDLVGPGDPRDDMETFDVPRLIRDIYAAAVGGVPDDWAELDPVVAAERQTAVLVRPVRIYSNAVA